MSLDRKERQLRYYQERIERLEMENRSLKGSFAHRDTLDITPSTILDLSSRNEKLQRQAQKYQYEIKKDLQCFIRSSNLSKECMFKNKYMKALNHPPAKRKYFFKI